MEEWWRAPDAEDVAILKLDEPLPNGVTPLLLGNSVGLEEHELFTFGFPSTTPKEGIGGKCEFVSRTTKGGGFPVLQLRSSEVTRGFSGAPVLDITTRRIVGMVTSITLPDEAGRQAETAFAIPTETLRAVCPVLEVSDLCPYRSLDAFTEADAEFFFGRQRVVDKLEDHLRQKPPFLAILGPSGSGKSSLVQAGLIPKLRSDGVSPARWGIILVRPADQPLGNLEVQGLTGASKDLVGAVRTWLEQHPEYERLMLVLDQFEEMFVVCRQELRQDFMAQLYKLLNARLSSTVVLIMRDDFYSWFAREASALLPWLEQEGALVHTALPLEKRELQAIVEEPAKAVGLTFEPGLVGTILEDVLKSAPEGQEGTGRSIVLPLLEFALTQLWERRQEGMLTHNAYQSIGGVTGGLTMWADRTFYSLNEEEQRLAQRVLISLVHLGDETAGLPDSSRREPLDSLWRDEAEREAVHNLVRKLADARLLVTGRDLVSGQEMVELTHNVLLREWAMFQGWVKENRRFLAWRQVMEVRAQRWKDTAPDAPQKREPERLLRGRELDEALDWVDKRKEEIKPLIQEFIRLSRERAEAERQTRERLRRRIIVGLAAGLVITLFLAFLAWAQRNQAVTEAVMRATAQAQAEERQQAAETAQAIAVAEASIRATAEANAVAQSQVALARRLAAQAELILNQQPSRFPVAVLLAIESLKHSPTVEGREALGNGLSLLPQLVFQTEIAPAIPDDFEDVNSLTFSPDSHWLAIGTSDEIIVWDTSTWKETMRVTPIASVRALAFSPDSRWLVSGADGGFAHVWDVATGRKISEMDHDGVQIFATAFSPDGRLVASGDYGTAVKVWEAATGHQLYSVTGDIGYIIVFSPDGKLVASSGETMIKVWETETGRIVTEKIQVIRDKNNPVDLRAIQALAFSPDGRLIASAEGKVIHRWVYPRQPVGGRILVWEAATGQDVAEMKHSDEVRGLEFTPDGERLISGTVLSPIRE